MLEPEEEYMLAKRWVEEQDTEAAHKMVTSHLRLAAKIAMGYRGYGRHRLKLSQRPMSD
jgi:RNA polymerase sigma-32 factor